MNIQKKTLSLEEKRKIFDQTKYDNFVESSRLEGIKITPVDNNLDAIVKKYQLIGADSADG